jgi:hypothetical protein
MAGKTPPLRQSTAASISNYSTWSFRIIAKAQAEIEKTLTTPLL